MTTPAVEREPTLELALVAYLDGLPVAGKTAVATTRIGTDLQTLVDTHGAVLRVRRSGGTEDEREARPRVDIEVYAATYLNAWTAAEGARSRLQRRYFWAGGYLIDRCVNESASTEQPHPNLRVLAQVWRVVTRL